LAVIAVVSYHLNIPAFRGGYLGVDMFFVLSGFLITSLLAREYDKTGTIRLPSFYWRRATRLFPALWFVVIVVAIFSSVYYVPGWSTPTLTGIPFVLFYIGNWVAAVHPNVAQLGLLDHTWSLAIEEQFYILWPATLIFGLHRGWSRRHLTYGILIAAAMSEVSRMIIWSLHEPASTRSKVLSTLLWSSTWSHAGGILIGSALGL